MGAGSSFAFASTLYLIGKWFPKERFAMMTGLAEMVGMIGTIIGKFVGWMLSLGLSPDSALNPKVYTITNYHWALAIIPLNQILAVFTAFYIPRLSIRNASNF